MQFTQYKLRLPDRFKSIGLMRILLLCMLLGITLGMYINLHAQEHTFAENAFRSQIADLEKTINLRMKNYEQILLGVSGLFGASKSVERDEFRAYVEHLQLPENYAGVQGVGYVEWIKPADLGARIDAVRAEGFPQFTIKPATPRDHYSAIIYIEPFDERNAAAFGVDMYAETVRRNAMNYAVIKDTIALSAKVRLAQEIKGEVQAGLLMYYPLYKKNKPPLSEAERWDALEGFAYIPFRVGNLMRSLLPGREREIMFKMFSGISSDPSAEIFSTDNYNNINDSSFKQKIALTLYGQSFTFLIGSTPKFELEHKSYFDEIVLVFGSVTSFLLFFLFISMSMQREHALNLARAMTVDINEKNRQLKRSEERFQLALESSQMGVWSWDFANNVTQLDASMQALFGQSGRSELSLYNSYENFLALVHPDDCERVATEIKQAIESHKDYRTEYRVVWRDKSIHHIAARAKIIRNDQAKPISMTGLCWDVTEAKRLDTLKSEFVSTVSHELRTPLTAVTGALGLAVSGALGELPEKMKILLDIAYKNSQRLKLLINDLLDMDKLLGGKLEFHCEPQVIMPLIERAIIENKAYADQYNVRYEIVADNIDYKINIEAERFLQVMANFLSNAAKFSPENAKVLVNLTTKDGWVRIAVMDQGVGISAESQKHMFEKFYQADSSTTRQKGGTGLGLAISKEIVERMNGRVGFMSQAEIGSTFYAEFLLV